MPGMYFWAASSSIIQHICMEERTAGTLLLGAGATAGAAGVLSPVRNQWFSSIGGGARGRATGLPAETPMRTTASTQHVRSAALPMSTLACRTKALYREDAW